IDNAVILAPDDIVSVAAGRAVIDLRDMIAAGPSLVLKSGETKRAEIYLDEGDLVIETFGEDGTTSKGTITLDADGNASLSGDLTVDGDTELGEVTASGPVTIDATAPAVELAAA